MLGTNYQLLYCIVCSVNVFGGCSSLSRWYSSDTTKFVCFTRESTCYEPLVCWLFRRQTCDTLVTGMLHLPSWLHTVSLSHVSIMFTDNAQQSVTVSSASWAQPLGGPDLPKIWTDPPTFYVAFWWMECDYVTDCTKLGRPVFSVEGSWP